MFACRTDILCIECVGWWSATYKETDARARSDTQTNTDCPKSDKHCNEADVLSVTDCPTDELLVLGFTLNQRESDQILQFPSVTPLT